jgi:hypothetical protein
MSCESEEPLPASPTDEDYEDFLMNPGDFEDFGDQMTWMAKAWIFEAILLDIDLLENNRLDSFYNADVAEPLGVLVKADSKIHSPGNYIEELFDLSTEIMDSLAVVVWIDEELYDLSPDSTALRSRREDAVDEIALLQDDRLDFLSDTESDQATVLALAATALGSLTTDTDFEEFYRRALLYEIEWRTSGPASLSAGDWEEIQEIATLCSWEGGKAAAIAQALCATARDSIIEPLVVCTGVNPRGSQSPFAALPDELMVYPNPSSTGWNVLLPSSCSELRVLDLSGRTYIMRDLSSSSVYFSSQNFLPGMYILHAHDAEGKILSSTKIILQR